MIDRKIAFLADDGCKIEYYVLHLYVHMYHCGIHHNQ